MCRRCYNRDYYQRKPEYRERLIAQNRARRAANPDVVRAYNVEYYATNKARETARKRAWREANPERQAEYNDKYRRRNLERYALDASARRARLAGAEGDFTLSDWEDVKQQYANSCAYCGTNEAPMTIEHMVPLSRGGAHDKRNIVPACKPCNSRKSTKTPDEYFEYLVSQERLARHD